MHLLISLFFWNDEYLQSDDFGDIFIVGLFGDDLNSFEGAFLEDFEFVFFIFEFVGGGAFFEDFIDEQIAVDFEDIESFFLFFFILFVFIRVFFFVGQVFLEVFDFFGDWVSK